MDKEVGLEFTGERFTPECVREIWYEHYHRYAFAKKLVKSKKVLDAACGEGYGSQVMSQSAKSVIGIDINEQTIKHATNRYSVNNLSFVKASCTELPFEDASFDVVVSFETLEHLSEHQQMLAEFNRVLSDDGILIISTPDKKHYSDATGFTNEYHVKELYKEEFRNLIDNHWEKQIWFAQAMIFSSILERIDVENNKGRLFSSDILDGELLETNNEMLKPMYYLVIASKKEIESVCDVHMFADKEQSVYEHYNKTIRDYIYLANKFNAMNKKHEKWLSHPILGKIIKFFK